MSENTAENKPKSNQMIKTLAFVGIIALILGVFTILSKTDKPPNMPQNAVHKLKFDAKGRFMGLDMDIPKDVVSAASGDMKYDKKAVEKTVHARCKTCHGSFPKPGEKLEDRVCTQMNAPCMPTNHPPKETCLKCHRVGPKDSGK